MNSQSVQYLLYGVLGAALIVLLIVRQVGERRWTGRRLLIFPLIFLIVAAVNGKDLGHDLRSGVGIGMFAAGMVLGVVLGLIRAHTMAVWRAGNVLVTRGNGWTMLWWGISIAVRIAMGFGAAFLGVPEGIGVAMLFAAVTVGVQNLWLAKRGGLLATAPARA